MAAVELFLLAEDGGSFKVDVLHRPYFYAAPARRWAKHARELAGVVARRLDATGAAVEVVEKEDLDMPNHVAGHRRAYLKLSFRSVPELMDASACSSRSSTRTRARGGRRGAAAAGGLGSAAARSAAARATTRRRGLDAC